jgi:malonyl-CoA O-methyltransferase
LDVRQAYRLWAPTYAKETLPHYLDGELAQAMFRGLPQTHLLDAGCGAGTRIRNNSGAVGIDLSPDVLAAGGLQTFVAGLRNHYPTYREFCRVCKPGGYVFVTDFHLDAILAGHRRTFNDQAGVVHEIENYERTNDTELALQAGRELVVTRDAAVGPSVRDFYVHGIGRRAYLRDFGLNLVRAYLFRRPEDVRL